MRYFIPLLVALSVTASPGLLGQSKSALPSISGTVLDPTGAAIAGATISVADERTGQTITSETDSAGHYEFFACQAGLTS